MSDSAEGPGWWQASDGKWYPPEQAPGYQQPGGAPAGGGNTDIGSTLSYAFNKFVQNIGEWIILWLILIAVFIVAGFVITAVAIGSSASGIGGFGFRFNIINIVLWVILGAVIGCVYVAIAKGAVMAVNGQKVDIGACFKLSTNNIIAGAIFGLIFGLLYSFCSLFGLVAFMFLGFMPVLSAIDDKGAESLSESINLTTSNSSETILYWLVAGLIASVLCGLGAPVAMIGGVYLVKRYRGEAVAPAS